MKKLFEIIGLFSVTLTFAYADQGLDIKKDYGSRPSWEVVVERIRSDALVGFEWIDQPPPGIALIGLPDRFCAVKFLSFRTGNDEGKGGMFRSSGVSQYAKIALIELPPHPTRDMLRQAKPRQISLSWRPLVGIGRLTHQRGHGDIRCGGVDLPWSYPTAISQSRVKGGDIEGLKLAPTAWKNFADINLRDSRLHWYMYDENREKIIVLPVTELPGGSSDKDPTPK